MNAITSDVKLELEKIAAMLPADTYPVYGYEKMTGKDAKLTDLKPPEGEEFEDEKEYVFQKPAFYEVNHYRRLKRAFIKNGVPGVEAYMNIYSEAELNN